MFDGAMEILLEDALEDRINGTRTTGLFDSGVKWKKKVKLSL